MSKYIDLDQVEFLKVDGNKEFNHGVDCCINTLLKQERVTAIPLDKIKQAIETLKQQPCEDCVSRQAVLDNAYAYGNGLEPEGYCVNVEDIQALPPVKPVQNWTPTSERLPKTNEYVGNVAKHYLIQDEFGDMEVAAYTTRGWIPIHTIEAFEYEVVAWQPLPKLYNAEKENEE